MGLFQKICKPFTASSKQAPSKGEYSRKARGDEAESAAIAYLQKQGLKLLERNYKTAGRGGGEIDAIMRAPDGTIVFVEVRLRSSKQFGGAAASVSPIKQQRILLAAQHYLARLDVLPPCRFDIMACEQANPWQWTWLKGAFDAS